MADISKQHMLLGGKVALITGGAQGLGKAFAEELLKQKVKVCICDVKQEVGERNVEEWKLKYGMNAMFVKCDVSNHIELEEVFKQAIAQFGGLDIVVNNAAVSELETDSWRNMIIVNLIGVIDGTKLAEKYMSLQSGGRGGVIINIGSAAGLTPFFYLPTYGAAKYGVVGFTKSAALNPSRATSGLRYVCLCPSIVETPMYTQAESIIYMPGNEAIAEIVNSYGLNKMEDVVEAFMQLLLTEDNNGGVMTISKTGGIQYHDRGQKLQGDN